ncbi:MAG: hypothetical protein ACI9ST_001276, partial [Psychrobacter glaciei]
QKTTYTNKFKKIKKKKTATGVAFFTLLLYQ